MANFHRSANANAEIRKAVNAKKNTQQGELDSELSSCGREVEDFLEVQSVLVNTAGT